MMLDLQQPFENSEQLAVQNVDHSYFSSTSPTNCLSENGRDTSTSPRDTLEEMRQTHSSILNVTSDAEESDDEDASHHSSILFADLNEPPRLDDGPPCTIYGEEQEIPKAVLACCNVKEHSNAFLKGWFDKSTTSIRTATENFTEKFCPASLSDEPCGSFKKYVSSSDTSLQHQMEMDILAILGCTEHPTEEELETWTTPLLCSGDNCNQFDKNILRKQSISNRAKRIYRLRRENKLENPVILKNSKTFDNSMLNETTVSSESSFHDALGTLFGIDESRLSDGKNIASITVDCLDGYGSDPEVSFRGKERNCEKKNTYDNLDLLTLSDEINYGSDDEHIIDAVQESLNFSWTIMWHPTKDSWYSVSPYDDQRRCFEPMCVQLWFERGHILHFGHTIVEPQFMWRILVGQNLAAPFQMRLLNVCRVLPLEDIDRSNYPLARASHSFSLRMVHGEEFVFEATSERERDLIVSRWKLVVARLAMLAVFEDIDSMSREFFTPSVDSQAFGF